MTHSLRSMIAAGLLCLVGCVTSGPKLIVADEELMRVGPEALGPIEAAKAEVRAAEDAVAAATRASASAERAVKIADLAVDRAELDVKIAQLRFQAAQETKDADAMLPAQSDRQAARDALKLAETELPFRKAEERQRRAIGDEADASLAEARAALELAKLEVVLGSKPDAGLDGEMRRADFKAQLAAAQSRRAEAKRGVTSAAIEVEAAQKSWESLQPASASAAETAAEATP